MNLSVFAFAGYFPADDCGPDPQTVYTVPEI